MKIGPYLLLKAVNHPAWLKTEKLARTMTEDQVDDILAGRRHVHRNPGKRKALDKYIADMATSEATGEVRAMVDEVGE